MAYISFFENDLELKIVKADDWKDALRIGFDLMSGWLPDDMEEAKVEAFNQDWSFNVVEID